MDTSYVPGGGISYRKPEFQTQEPQFLFTVGPVIYSPLK